MKKSIRVVCAALALLPSALVAQQQQAAAGITLQQAVEMAQKQGYQSTAAIATRDAARATENAFFARRLPQLSLNGQAPVYQKDIQPVIQPDGSTLFTPVQQTTARAGLTMSQLLPFTGGTLSVTSSLQRYDRTGGTGATRTWTSAPVTFAIQQPILRSNPMRWDGRAENIRLDAAERAYLEEREGVAISASEAFFDLYIAKRTLENQTANAAINDTLYTLNKGRLEVGKIGENDLLQSELALLRSRAQLDQAKLDYERMLAAFRLVINVSPGTPADVAVPTMIPDIEADTTLAVAQALRNRARLSELELQGLQARRAISEARWGGPQGATINASVGFNQTAPEMNLAYQDLLQAQRFSVFIELPVLSWGARGSDVRAAKAGLKRVDALSRQAREQLQQEAHFAALGLAQARRNLVVSAKADTVAAKRFEVAYNRYVIGRIGIDNLYIAQNEKDQAVNQYLQALRSFWLAYYRLRQVTLYDFETGQPIR